MNIKMVDLHGQYLKIKEEIDDAISNAINSSQFINGPQVSEFAHELAQYNNVGNVITCANGTDALQIAMMALDFKQGDEIILPAHTYVATAEVIAILGLKPVFVDVDPKTFNIDPSLIEESISSKTVAIVPVHLYGQCADMEPLLAIAEKHGLKIIEDAAQAIGADYIFSNGKVMKAGTMGNLGTTSFFPTKNLGCFGDGGAIFTNDDYLANQCRLIANHGQKVKYQHDLIGVNSRLDTLQAAILQVKLKYLNEFAEKRQKVARFYDNAFTDLSFIDIPFYAFNSTHVFHQYTLKTNGIERDSFKTYLQENGIPSIIYYPIPLYLQKAYRTTDYPEGSFLVTEELSKTVLSLPLHTELTEDQLFYISEKINGFLKA